MTARVHRVMPGEPVSLERFTQGAAEVLDLAFDWTLILETAETIVTSTWASTPEGLTIDDTAIDLEEPTPIAVAFIEGGAVGVWYLLTNTITTSADRTYVRSVRIDVVER